jgi:ribosomal protein S12 methylthiotransferase accessory factor
MKFVVLIVGEGQLADFVNDILSNSYEVRRESDLQAPLSVIPDLALVLHDSWNPGIHNEDERLFRSIGVPWLRGFVNFGIGTVGPFVFPDSRGCSQCSDARRFMARFNPTEMWQLKRWLTEQKVLLPSDAWGSKIGLLQIAHLLTAEVARVFEGSRAYTEGHVYLINLQSLQIRRHFFLPDPKCPRCGESPEDEAKLAEITLEPMPKTGADSYRTRSLKDLRGVLGRDYFDTEIGLFNEKMHDYTSPFAVASVNLPLVYGDEISGGRTHSYEDSELTAILEGLERYCGIEPRWKRTTVHDSYRNLASQALNPMSVGVHANEEYAKPGFPFQPFDRNQAMDWVWGYSFLQQRPILVPELLAYYSVDQKPGYVYETSNGSAIGGSLEEAIFYGIMEVVERDSFLMTWYARLPLPRIDLGSINDQEVQLMIQRLRAVAGYDLHLFNSTMENGIPSVWAIATNLKDHGLQHSCTAGAHVDPLRAVKGAIQEIAGHVSGLGDFFQFYQEEYIRMYQDSSLVRSMEDHPMIYGLPKSKERLTFLLDDDRPLRSFDKEFKMHVWQPDLTEDLRHIIDRFKKLNMDVIVVNQTTPEIMRNGLHCVKVIIPGMLPMTFGNHLKRLIGLDRVLKIPFELGYVKRPLILNKLNPNPHPFF